jgi:hypothetical protein
MLFPNPDYKDRLGRNQYLIDILENYLKDINLVLNLGGGQKRYLKDTKFKVTEVDIEGDNDLNLDLDKIDKLPFETNSFDVSIALDVLEHLENFHLLVDEMNRVSKKYIIISLPNCFPLFYEILMNNNKKNSMQNGYYHKFYGLPLTKPIDRHRWFLTIGDIERFFYSIAEKNNFKIDILLPKSKSFKSKVLNLFLNHRLKKEILTKYVWIIIKKN